MKGVLSRIAGLVVVVVSLSFSSCVTQKYLNAEGKPFERTSFSLFSQTTNYFTEKVETGRELTSEKIIEEDRFEQQTTNQAEINAATQQRAAEERARNRWFQEGQDYQAALESKYADYNAMVRMGAINNDQKYQYYMNSRNAPAVTTTIPQPQYVKVKVGVNRIRVTTYRIQYKTTTYYLESTGKLPTVEMTVEEKEERNRVS
jgi:hypothetical protein